MPVTDGNVLPLARLKLWSPGQGDPLLTTREFAFYETLDAAFGRGTVSQVEGEPALECLPGVGLVCRPRLEMQDTRLADFSTSGGAWEERRPGTGAPRKYRLIQYSTTAGAIWSATSRYTLPADPSIALSFLFVDSPPDWNAVDLPPLIRVEFGAVGGMPQYALEFRKGSGARLLTWNPSVAEWWVARNLPEPRRASQADGGETWMALRCHRGRIGISTDGGREYAWYALPVGTRVAAGPLTVRGQGGMLAFGVHSLRYDAGDWTSPSRNTFTARSLAAELLLEARADATYGAVALVDLSAPEAAEAQYRVTLTPTSTLLSSGWMAYHSPEVYAVQGRYPAEVSLFGFTGIHDQPYPDLLSIRVEKPRELDTGGATVICRLDPESAFAWTRGRFAKAQVELGHLTESGAELLQPVLMGYVTEVELLCEEPRRVTLRLRIANGAERFRQARWTRLDSFPLGGRTLNQALDLILETEGIPLTSSYRTWDYVGDGLGNQFLLPPGSPEEPFEWPRPGEAKWTTMQRLAGYAGLEVVPLDDGAFATLPQTYVAPWVRKVYEATPSADLTALALRLRWGLRSRESATAVVVDGVDPEGTRLLAWAADTTAETNVFSPRFSPFRVTAQETVEGTTTPGLLLARTAALATSLFPNAVDADLTHPVDLLVARRDQVRIEGFTQAGLEATHRFVVVALSHQYEVRPDDAPILETTAALLLLE